jgi:hypothetical protein
MDLADDAAAAALTSAGLAPAAARDALGVLSRLPIVSVRWAVDAGGADGRLAPGDMVELVVDLVRTVRGGRERGRDGTDGIGAGAAAYAPCFPKPQTEGWWLVCADLAADDVKAIRRVALGRHATVTLAWPAPMVAGTYTYALMLLSDVYLGLDQQYDVPVHVRPPEPPTTPAPPFHIV